MSLVDAVNSAAGQPATIRVGIVTSTSPLRVDVQGTPYEGFGRIGSMPAVGDVVLMLGQSVRGSGSSGSSWVMLGTIQPT